MFVRVLSPTLFFATVLLGGCGRLTPGPSAATLTAAGQGRPTATAYRASAGTVQHIVIIFQENRTPDNLFQGLPGADIASSGLNSSGQVVPLQPIPLKVPYDISHTHSSFVRMYDGGKMDGADREFTACHGPCPYQHPMYGYVPASDDQPYLDLAAQYAFADRMFQTNQGGSFPAHQYIIAGTSEPRDGSSLLAAENPLPFGTGAGCTAPANATVAMINAKGNESTSMYPCFEHPALMDLLDQAGISWKYYANKPNGIWTGPNAIRHLRQGPDWQNVDLTTTDVLGDISNNRLAQVSWVIPKPVFSDHAGSTDGSGPSWVAQIVNAIGQSQYWNTTTIFITWDDWGGWYDHVAPPTIYNSYELGFRVPLIVVSPYAKGHYVSHVTHEFGSILKYTEETFGLPSLGYTDLRADDLADCFNYQNAPARFKPIRAPYSAAYFLKNAHEGVDAPEDY